eukprot:s440_g4.t1
MSSWESPIFHGPGDDGRLRDPFPLPRFQSDWQPRSGLCRASSRRILRRAHLAERANRALDSLNSLFFGGANNFVPPRPKPVAELRLSQRLALSDVMMAVKGLGAPPDACLDSGAQKVLRVAASAYCEPEVGVGDVVPLCFDSLSLPSSGSAGVELCEALDEPLQEMVRNFESTMLQDDDVWCAISRDTSHLKPYSDPSLKSRGKYLKFLRLLYDRGILSFTQGCRGRVGAFAVSKKPKVIQGKLSARQRLVLDCRQTNQLFRPSPHTELGSLASLTELEIPHDSCLFVSGADIQDCFYAVHIPSELMAFFCLEGDISGWEVRNITGGKFDCDEGSSFSPCFTVLPMGFSWSFFLVQRIHQLAVLRSLGIDENQLVLDGRPPPKLDHSNYVSMPYCDNIHSLALDKKLCDDGSRKIIHELQSLGFSIHEEEPASRLFSTLGGEIDGEAGQIRMTRKRAWDIILAFEFVAEHMVHPTTMQKLLGHAMFFSTLNRAGMSVFRRCYDFVEKGGNARFLSSREREECLVFAGLVPLLFADIRRQWSSTIFCTDASPEGYGICERVLPPAEVADIGRWNERWRYARLGPEEWAPRRRALGLDTLCGPNTVVMEESVADLAEVFPDENFPEVKSCRVLSRTHYVPVKKKQGQRVVPVSKPGQFATQRNLRPLRPASKGALRSNVGGGKKVKSALVRDPVVKKRSKSLRTVGRLPMNEEESVGSRAQKRMLTGLEKRSISVEVMNQYQKYLTMFENFCRGSGLGWPVKRDVDAILADYLDVMFLENRSAAEGEKTVAAVEFMNISLKGQLARSKRALRGWRKERPPQSRLPLPRLVACGMASIMVAENKKLMGLKLMADHDTYLRPGESIDLRGKDIIPPVKNSGKQYRWFSLVVRDIEDQRPDKTGTFDNSVPFNSPGREYLGELLHKRAKSLVHPNKFLYPFTAAEYRKAFQKAGEQLGVKSLHPYQTRHGGASEDLNTQERDHMTVKSRGRWQTDQSVRRYGKVGKVQKLLVQLSPANLEFCQWSSRNMEQILKGTVAARKP